jgi:hypothetical protein
LGKTGGPSHTVLLEVTNRGSLWRCVTRVRNLVRFVPNRGISARFVTLSMQWGVAAT